MKYKSLNFGAVLWDVINGMEHIGGTSYNLAAHLGQLGIKSDFISGVGNDARGDRILEVMMDQGMDVRLIQRVEGLETGYVAVTLNENGIPSYEIPDSSAFDHISYTGNLEKAVSHEKYDILCFGTFDQRSARNRETLRNIWKNVNAKTCFFDVNLRKPFYSREIIEESLLHAHIVKINDEELIELSKMLYGEIIGETRFFKKLGSDFDIQLIIETKGKQGCTMWEDGRVIDISIPGVESEIVVDTVGSGDAFCAGFLWSWCQGFSIEICAENGNRLGTYVAHCAGAVPPLSDEIKKLFNAQITDQEI